jgi:hypothetical protein
MSSNSWKKPVGREALLGEGKHGGDCGTNHEGAPRLSRTRAPRVATVPALAPWLHGQRAGLGGEEVWRPVVRLATDRVLQEGQVLFFL